jgi:RNA exonuclease 4
MKQKSRDGGNSHRKMRSVSLGLGHTDLGRRAVGACAWKWWKPSNNNNARFTTNVAPGTTAKLGTTRTHDHRNEETNDFVLSYTVFFRIHSYIPFIASITTMGFFITKKQKQLMRDRRRKKKGFLDSREQQQDKSADAKSESKKRSHASSSSLTEDSNRIVLPTQLSHQEAKKFRKDARRKARIEGRGDFLLEFVSESDQAETKETNAGAPPRNKKPKTSFPSLKDLVEKEKLIKEQEKRANERLEEQETLSEEYKARYVALDCEMVGVGSSGKKSALARVSITDWDGKELLDTFVKVPDRVTDFRTHVSGVKPKHLKSAMDVNECRQIVAGILKDKILVGHALKNDLDALLLRHSKQDVRDTAKYRPFQRLANSKWRPRKLRDLVQQHLNKAIQVQGESHDSLDDARATMELFQLVRKQWEEDLLEKTRR